MTGIPFHPRSQDMARDSDKPHLDVILDSQYLVLKGTGPDVDPTMLSGHVRLFLTEATSIKQITLQFKGKAKIPALASDSIINNSASSSHVVCNHDWSFLEGDKKHSRTLKAGRHLFPFHFEISGSLPSSLSTSALGNASVAYKLHAIATRPGLSHNLQAVAPVFILRSMTREALEYQQTLDIENSWPEKLMYGITLPHKVWAAGDTLTAIVKLSPLAKGVYVQSIFSSITETTKIYTRSGSHENTREVASVTHEIIDHKAVEVEVASPNSNAAAGLSSAQPVSPHFGPSSLNHHPPDHQQEQEEEEDLEFDTNDVITYVNLSIPPSSAYPFLYSASDAASPTTTPPRSASPTHQHPSLPLSSNSAVSQPTTSPLITPSHDLEPIFISHRIKWKIFIRNSDGHASELRCSLPIKILDGAFLDESRVFTMRSRRLLLRINGLGNVLSRGGEGSEGEDNEGAGVDEEEEEGRIRHLEADRELPSYPAHVRDRVANMYLSEAMTMRVSNPWVGRVGPADAASGSGGSALSTLDVSGQGESDTIRPPMAVVSPGDPTSTDRSILHTQPHSRASRSGHSTPATQQQVHMMSHLPHAPGSGESASLDWVNSELLLSLSLDEEALRRIGGIPSGGGQQYLQPQPQPPHQHQTDTHNQQHQQGKTLRWGSQVGSRAGSRAASPERIALSTSNNDNGSSSVPEGTGGVYGSSTTPGSGFTSPFQNLFKATIKPFTNFAGHHGHGHRPTHPRSRSTTSLIGLLSTSSASASGSGRPLASSGLSSGTGQNSSSSPVPQNEMVGFISTSPSPLSNPGLESQPEDRSSFIFRAFSVVPDYSIASRGFIGGVPPLSSMRGLPSYEEAEAQRKEREAEMEMRRPTSIWKERGSSEPDLVGRFGRRLGSGTPGSEARTFHSDDDEDMIQIRTKM